MEKPIKLEWRKASDGKKIVATKSPVTPSELQDKINEIIDYLPTPVTDIKSPRKSNEEIAEIIGDKFGRAIERLGDEPKAQPTSNWEEEWSKITALMKIKYSSDEVDNAPGVTWDWIEKNIKSFIASQITLAKEEGRKEAYRHSKLAGNPSNWLFALEDVEEEKEKARTEALEQASKAVGAMKLGKPNLAKGHPDYKRFCEDNEINDETVSQAIQVIKHLIHEKNERAA